MRRLEMAYWETADENPSVTEPELEFARIWQDLPKIVFSKTLSGSRATPGWLRTALPRRSPG
jgi:hypothetical protein